MIRLIFFHFNNETLNNENHNSIDYSNYYHGNQLIHLINRDLNELKSDKSLLELKESLHHPNEGFILFINFEQF